MRCAGPLAEQQSALAAAAAQVRDWLLSAKEVRASRSWPHDTGEIDAADHSDVKAG
jgi:hypothetical protein